MPDETAAQLATLSRRMRWLCLAMLPLIVMAGGWAVYGFATDPAGVAAISFPDAKANSLFIAPWQRAGLAIVALVKLLLFAAAFHALADMFGCFARGQTMSAVAAAHLRKAGQWFVLAAIFGVFAHTASIVLLTLGNPAGERQLSVAFSSDQLFPLILAGVLFAVGHILESAARIAEENRGFV